MDPLTLSLLLGVGGGLLSSFGGGGGTNFSDIFNAIKAEPAFQPKIPKYPGGEQITPGGGGYTQGTKTVYDFTGIKPKQLNQLLSGKKGKNLSDDFRKALKEGKRSFTVEELTGFHKQGLLPGFLSGKNKIKVGKKDIPFGSPMAEPESENLFGIGRDAEILNALNNIKNIGVINNSLLPSLQGLNLNAFNAANKLVQGGFDSSSLSPDVENRIQGASNAFVDEANIDLNRSFRDSTTGIAQELANLGYVGESTGGYNVFNRLGRNLTDAQGRIALQGQQYAEQLRQNEIENRRQAFGTMAGVPAFGSGLNTLMSPNLNINPAYQNPTGQFSFESLLNQLNQQNAFAIQREGIRQQPYLNALPGAIGAASQPGLAGTLGSTVGSLAPWMLLGGKNIQTPGWLSKGSDWLGGIIGNITKGIGSNFGQGPQGHAYGLI